MHVRHPFPAVPGRGADPRVVGVVAVAQRFDVGAVQLDPPPDLDASADRSVAGDEDIDVARHRLEQPQGRQVVLDRVGGVVEVEHRDEHVGQHVAGHEHSPLLDEQGCVARSVCPVLDDPDRRPVPRQLRRPGRKAVDEAQQVQGHLPVDLGGQVLGDPRHGVRVGRLTPCSGRAAPGAVAGRRAEPRVPEEVVPVRVCREAQHHAPRRVTQVVGQAVQLGAGDAGVDEQHAVRALHHHGVALHELALVDQHAPRDLDQHRARCPASSGSPRAVRSARTPSPR